MKVKGFGARPSRNVSTGGRRPLGDPFNKSFKGDPFNKEYKKDTSPGSEYSSYNFGEYHYYPEQKDMTAEEYLEKTSASEKSKNSADSRKIRNSRIRLVQQVAALVVGSTVIVSAYQASMERKALQQAAPEPTEVIVDVDNGYPDDGNTGEDIVPTEPASQPTESETEPTEAETQSETVAPAQASSGSAPGQNTQSTTAPSSAGTSVSWKWSSDHKTVSLVITDSAGKVISETAAAVTESQTPATCRSDGKITYTAKAQANGQTYTDTSTEVIPALGHSFNNGTEVTLEDGSTAMDFECTRCHEHFVIKNSAVEE